MARMNLSPVVFAVLLASTGQGEAMQNPLYSGVNRIVLDCTPSGGIGQGLCAVLADKLEGRLRMPVSREEPATNAMGVLRVRLEAAASASNRYRLVWTNDAPVRGGPATFTGAWVDSASPAPTGGQNEALAEALVATRP